MLPSDNRKLTLKAAPPMPAKKTNLTDAERARRIRETAREIGTDNDPASFDRAFKKVVRPATAQAKPVSEK